MHNIENNHFIRKEKVRCIIEDSILSHESKALRKVEYFDVLLSKPLLLPLDCTEKRSRTWRDWDIHSPLQH